MNLLSLPVPRTIPSLITAMESLHTPRGPYVSATSPTGETFLTFRPEPVNEDTLLPAQPMTHFPSEESAIRAFWNEFIKYSSAHHGAKLYWRIKPAFYHDIRYGRDTFYIRARLILSDKRVISREVEQKCLGIGREAA